MPAHRTIAATVAFLLCLALAATPTPAAAAVRVLAVPLVAARSHLFVMWAVVEQLAVHGNEVALLIVEPDVPVAAALLAKAPPAAASRISLVPYADAAPPGWWGAYLTGQAGSGAAPAMGTGHVRAWVAQADALLSDDALIAALKSWAPDSVLGDIAFLATTGLAARLGLPLATLSCTGPVDPLHADLLGLDNNLATTPQFGTGLVPPLGWEGTALNVAAYVTGKAFFRYVWHTIWQPVATKHRIPLMGSAASRPNELAHLFSADFAVEWPRAVPANVHFVGPILAGNTTEPVPPALQTVLDGAGDGGAVLVSFGTSLSLDVSIYRTVAGGLAALDPPSPVIWKLAPSDLGGADPSSIFTNSTSPPHITLLPWIPQNALLQSGRISAFLTHGGANSLYEAAFHGVPVAGLPFFGDALDNVAKAVSRGFGISLGRPAHLTPGKVAGGLGALRADPRYRTAAAAASTRLVARPGPARVVAADIVQRATEDYWAVREVSGGDVMSVS